MQYWDEMNSKFGFDDGAAIPPDAEDSRTVYLRAINALAVEEGSNFRMHPYDRPGMHNWCLVAPVPKDIELDDALGVPTEMDWEMQNAIARAHGLDLDRFVQTTVEIDWNGFGEALTLDGTDTKEEG